jgi:hypothetical protein
MRKNSQVSGKGSGLVNRTNAAIMIIGLALVSSASFAAAAGHSAGVPSFGNAGSYAILAGTAVTCTDSSVGGNVGVWPGNAITQTNCVISGSVDAGNNAAKMASKDFLNTYDAFKAVPCDVTLTGTLAGVTLSPGVYCFDAAATLTGTLTLDGPSGAVWIFKIGTLAAGALTGTDFNVVMNGGGDPCNVYWWVDAAATLTDSNFIGTILAGMAVTVKGGTFHGNIYAKAAVTVTSTQITPCEGGSTHGNGGKGCNQGVGNGPENCDPGNSNQGDPSRSNDELGGTPGSPGRQGGNGR